MEDIKIEALAMDIDKDIFQSLCQDIDNNKKYGEISGNICLIIAKNIEKYIKLKNMYETTETIHNSDSAKCKSIGCQFYDEKMEFNCSANESLCEKCMNNQHFA